MSKKMLRAAASFDAKMLAEFLNVAAAFTKDDEHFKVKLEVYADGKPMLVRTHNGKGQEFKGAIMPLT
jgi:hypothetical protein